MVVTGPFLASPDTERRRGTTAGASGVRACAFMAGPDRDQTVSVGRPVRKPITFDGERRVRHRARSAIDRSFQGTPKPSQMALRPWRPTLRRETDRAEVSKRRLATCSPDDAATEEGVVIEDLIPRVASQPPGDGGSETFDTGTSSPGSLAA